MSAPLVEVRNLSRVFSSGRNIPMISRRKDLRAVSDVSFTIHERETLGLVGESGCGKSTVGRLVLGMLAPTSGEVTFDGAPVAAQIGSPEWRAMRRSMQMVFQNPFGALNPRLTILFQLREVLDTHDIGAPDDRTGRVVELAKLVGLDPSLLDRYVHQLSGGQLQRAVIARALAVSPRFLVCDEAVAALDVSIQAQVINLLQDLQDEQDLTYLFISHDLGVVRHMCDRIIVMYLGRIVEEGPSEALFAAPRHPYTRALLAAAPQPDPRERKERLLLEGDLPSPYAVPSGCVFRTRCPLADEHCASEAPVLRAMNANATHRTACHFADRTCGEPSLAL